MRKQTIALLNRIWKERAHQVGGDDDGDDEPRSADGSSKAVELIRHLKSRKDIWNKILRYEVSMVRYNFDPIMMLTSAVPISVCGPG